MNPLPCMVPHDGWCDISADAKIVSALGVVIALARPCAAPSMREDIRTIEAHRDSLREARRGSGSGPSRCGSPSHADALREAERIIDAYADADRGGDHTTWVRLWKRRYRDVLA